MADAPRGTIGTEMRAAYTRWRILSFYDRFEELVVLVLTALIAIIVVAALWSLVLRVIILVFVDQRFDPTDHTVFQVVFGAIFTVIIALEFKRSVLVLVERSHGIIQVRTVVLLAMLAVLRKLMIIDFAAADSWTILALSAAILSLGGVYWLVRDQDRALAQPDAAAGNR